MDFGRHANSEISNEEHDQSSERTTNDDNGVGRSYECVYCKRGFTNAQALGGHMNIHRKDKSSAAKQDRKEPSAYCKQSTTEDYKGFRYNFEPISKEQKYYYYHPIYSQRSNLNNYQYFSLHEDVLGTELSLRIGPSEIEEEERRNMSERKKNEVDLELRLGYDQYNS